MDLQECHSLPMDRVVLFFTSGTFAICVYLLLIVLLFFGFKNAQETPRSYTTYKETTFSIDLVVEEVKEQKKLKVAQKKAEKKIEEIPIKKESASKTANVGTGITDLFKQVESQKSVKTTQPQSENDKIAKKKKADKSSQAESLESELEKIMSNLDTQKTLNFVTPKGEYNAFYAKVHEILAQNWNPMRTAVEHYAEVEITIDAQGRFSYFIVRKSGDLEFDEALQGFLDIMRSQEFPAYEGGDQTKIMVTFKTEV